MYLLDCSEVLFTYLLVLNSIRFLDNKALGN